MNTNESTTRGAGAWGWVVIVLVSALVVAWGLAAYVLVRDVPRTWHRGSLPDTPGESIYSTAPAPATATAPLQIPPLPEAQPKPTATGGRP
jgi:hypothetical protein